MEGFIERFCSKYQIPFQEGKALVEQMELITYRKGECLVREGERNTSFYLIAEGVWRGHYLRNGVDVSVWFAVEGEAMFSTSGYVGGQASRVTIEAMCDSTLYRISKQALEHFFSRSVGYANLGRRLFEQEFLTLENWLINGGATQAKERYLALLADKPRLLQCVPLKYIASYLYITPQSLSRIRAELARSNPLQGCSEVKKR